MREIKTLYVIAHPFYGQDAFFREEKKAEWRKKREGEVLNLISEFKSTDNSYLVFFATGSEPKSLEEELNYLPNERVHIVYGPNDYIKSKKKIGNVKFSRKLEVKVFGAYIGACLLETTGTLLDYIHKLSPDTKINLWLVGGDVIGPKDYDLFLEFMSRKCDSVIL